MPKATKPHYQKKNPAAHEAWKRRKQNMKNLVGRASSPLFQKWWRQEVLNNRLNEGTFTEKNLKELSTVFDHESAHFLAMKSRAELSLGKRDH